MLKDMSRSIVMLKMTCHLGYIPENESWEGVRTWTLSKKHKNVEAYQGCQAWEDFELVAMIELI